jgi:hypothetical protein
MMAGETRPLMLLAGTVLREDVPPRAPPRVVNNALTVAGQRWASRIEFHLKSGGIFHVSR